MHFKDDLKTWSKFQQLHKAATKFLLRIFRSENKELVQRMMSSLR